MHSQLAIFTLACLMTLSRSQFVIEGDMAISLETLKVMNGKNIGYEAATRWKWPNGNIPYAFQSGFDSNRQSLVRQAIQEFESKTCLRFVKRTTEHHYLSFGNTNKGCWSWIGRQSSRSGQLVSIGNGCAHLGTVLHEIMHAIGFFHEQSRRDRDNFVRINYQNIQQGQAYNFRKYSHGQADTFGEPYDMGSLMHYTNREFSRNGRNTIEAVSNPSKRLGNRQGFSASDLRQINKMYNCANIKPIPVTKSPQPATQQPTPGSCGDILNNCRSLVNLGYCTTYNRYMTTYCKKSCNKCPSTSCRDLNNFCPGMARSGQCITNYKYMNTFCKGSCRYC